MSNPNVAEPAGAVASTAAVASTDDGLAALRSAIDAHLAAVGEPAVVDKLAPLPGGACQDNFVVDCRGEQGPARYVLRSDARSSLMGSISRRVEAGVVNAAVAAGVATPPALWPAEGLVRGGAAAYFMPWVAGVAIGRKVVADPRLADARAGLPGRLADELARIHTVTPANASDLFANAPANEPSAGAIKQLKARIDGLSAPRPALRRVLAWLADNRPTGERTVLVHGDYRTGNFMVAAAGLQAILDWEFAHWGSPAEDLSWICVRDWRFGALDLPVGGFGHRPDFLAAYEDASGTTVDPEALHWWEVMGNARWAVGAVQQAHRYLSGAERDLEYLAIGRRVVEMEWEALRLIRTGVPRWREQV